MDKPLLFEFPTCTVTLKDTLEKRGIKDKAEGFSTLICKPTATEGMKVTPQHLDQGVGS